MDRAALATGDPVGQLPQLFGQFPVDPGINRQQHAHMGIVLQEQQRIQRIGPGFDPEVVQHHQLTVHADFGAQPQPFVAEQGSVRAPARGEHLAKHQRGIGCHLDARFLAVAGLAVGDQLVRQVLQHRPGTQAQHHLLDGFALRGAVHLGGGLGGQQQAATRGDLDLDPVPVGTQVAPTGVHYRVAHLGAVIQVVRTQHPQGALVVLGGGDILSGTPSDL